MCDSTYYYLGADRLHSGQYISLIKLLEDEGLVVNLISFFPISRGRLSAIWQERRSIGPNPLERVRADLRGTVHLLPGLSRLPNLSVLPLAWTLDWPSSRHSRLVLHAKQLGMASLAVEVKRLFSGLRVIAELEGDPVAELEYLQAKASRPLSARAMSRQIERQLQQEKLVVSEADAILCVSTKLKEVVVQRQHLSSERAEKISLFPSVASRQRFYFDPERRSKTRRALHLEDRYVVTFSGNLRSAWQVPDKLVDVFRMVKEIQHSAFFLVLTPETEWRHIEPYLLRAGFSATDYRLQASPHGEVVDYLCAADVGLLLRERHLMNEVAAPGKFAEYVLAGLPVILTDGIGDFSAQLYNSEFACILPDLTGTASARELVQSFARKQFTSAQRVGFSSWAATRVSMEALVPRLAQLYQQV